jgi:hypothetical protein
MNKLQIRTGIILVDINQMLLILKTPEKITEQTQCKATDWIIERESSRLTRTRVCRGTYSAVCTQRKYVLTDYKVQK